jgi:hypothetical protein
MDPDPTKLDDESVTSAIVKEPTDLNYAIKSGYCYRYLTTLLKTPWPVYPNTE